MRKVNNLDYKKIGILNEKKLYVRKDAFIVVDIKNQKRIFSGHSIDKALKRAML